jgi:hypothetical protein
MERLAYNFLLWRNEAVIAKFFLEISQISFRIAIANNTRGNALSILYNRCKKQHLYKPYINLFMAGHASQMVKGKLLFLSMQNIM